MSYPKVAEAFSLLDILIDGYSKQYEEGSVAPSLLRQHSLLVATCAEILATKIHGMDSKKAYALGLLHDYGKVVNEKAHNLFHGLSGYKIMKELGYDEVAKICLTHTFIDKEFKYEDYITYPKEELTTCKKLLKEIDYDEYDKLIQMSDMMVTVVGFKTLKERMIFIREKYKLCGLTMKKKYRQVLKLKDHFDKLCGCDIYKLLGVA